MNGGLVELRPLLNNCRYKLLLFHILAVINQMYFKHLQGEDGVCVRVCVRVCVCVGGGLIY